MILVKSIICWVSLFTATAVSCQAKAWCGLEPLRSTRSDVERVLSLQRDDCKCCRDTGLEFVRADYSEGRCQGDPPGWNVSAETVLRLHLRPTSELLFSALRLDPNRYVISGDDASWVYYASRGEGVMYSVQNERVEWVDFMPTTADQRLRCPGFPAEDGSITVHTIFHSYDDRRFDDEAARLDNFAINLQQVPTWKGYIMVYAGRRARPNEAKRRGERARRYLIERRGIEPDRVTAIDGGHREEFTVELYLIHKDYSGPAARPGIGTKDVQIIRRGRRR